MNSEEKKMDEMKNVEEETIEKNVEQPATEEGQPAEGEAQNEAEEPEKELTPEEKLQAEVEKLQAEQEEMKDKYLRLSAEFDNYRKRTMKEKAELILNGGEKAVSAILPIIDDMERAILPVIDDMERALATMQKATDVEAVKEGVDLIYNKFIQILGQNGVQAIETKEKELDTDYHDAIAIIDAPTEELKGKILDCVETGYTLNDKVIRHAKVVVGK